MNPDVKTVEQLVEIITREVLIAMAEQQQRAAVPEGGQCKFNCADGLCVRTCFDRAGKVVERGRRAAFIHHWHDPARYQPGKDDRPHAAQTGRNSRPDCPALL